VIVSSTSRELFQHVSQQFRGSKTRFEIVARVVNLRVIDRGPLFAFVNI